MTAARDLAIHGSGPDALTVEQCRRLLATHTFGRVGATSGGLPVILPARYVYEDDIITFRTGGGTKLRAAEHGDVLAFEVDAYDVEHNEGWSVLVRGRATVLTTDREHDGLPTLDAPHDGDRRNHYVRLHCELLTGHRLP